MKLIPEICIVYNPEYCAGSWWSMNLIYPYESKFSLLLDTIKKITTQTTTKLICFIQRARNVTRNNYTSIQCKLKKK
jgi:hypothetical protein